MMDKYELISKIICDLNRLELKGVDNWAIVINCIQWLTKLKEGLKEEEERRNGTDRDQAREHNQNN